MIAIAVVIAVHKRHKPFYPDTVMNAAAAAAATTIVASVQLASYTYVVSPKSLLAILI